MRLLTILFFVPDRSPTGNHVLDALPLAEFATVAPSLVRTVLETRGLIYRPYEAIDHIYFPVDCALSVITAMGNGDSVEICTIGREGFSGSQLIFNARIPETEMICQIGGPADAMPVKDFQQYFDRLPEFRRLAMAFMESLFNFMGQSIACNRLHNLNERCARWLLSTQDRIERDEFYLTQEFLAMMLGTGRPAVTAAAGALQEAGLIRYHRGNLTIVDRAGLERAACECYRITARSLRRAMALE